MERVASSLFRRFFFVLLVLAGCDASPPAPGGKFYTYTGFRDWWRFPLQFPFHVIIIDTFESGNIEKYDAAGDIADPNASSTEIVDDVTAISPAAEYVAFRRKKDWGVLIYRTEETLFFDTDTALISHLRQCFPAEPRPNFQSLELAFRTAWEKSRLPKQ